MNDRPFRQCSSTGCLKRAEYAPKLCVPAKNMPVEANKHLSMICGVPFCEDHIIVTEAEQLLNRHTRSIIDKFTKGKAPPDYERAFVLHVLLESNEYRKWETAHKKGKTL